MEDLEGGTERGLGGIAGGVALDMGRWGALGGLGELVGCLFFTFIEAFSFILFVSSGVILEVLADAVTIHNEVCLI